MKLNPQLEYDLIAVEHEETIHVLLDLEAPPALAGRERPPANLQVVLDRSGSMTGERLEAARSALHSVVDRLGPGDTFGLVAFDDAVVVPIAAGPLDKPAAQAQIAAIGPGGMTNLSAGLLRGFQEANRGANGRGASLVLLSDGHANQGLVDHDRLGALAEGARGERISTATIGMGLDYDEDLLAAISRGGAANTHFAEDGDAAGAALASEVEGLLEQVIQAASLTVRPAAEVAAVRLFNDLPSTTIDDGFMVELGDFAAEQTRRLLLEVDVPGLSGLGLRQVGKLELRWVELDSMKSQLTTIRLQVNIVPGDEAAGRTANSEVSTEIAFQLAQRAKRDATDALRDGDQDRAIRVYSDAAGRLRATPNVPEDFANDLATEAASLESLADEVSVGRDAVAAKRARMEINRQGLRRERRRGQ